MPRTKKLFQRRHYEWLAHFAGANLSTVAARHLAEALVGTNGKYDKVKFLQMYHRVRNFTKAHERMHSLHAHANRHTQQVYNEAAAAIWLDEALHPTGILPVEVPMEDAVND